MAGSSIVMPGLQKKAATELFKDARAFISVFLNALVKRVSSGSSCETQVRVGEYRTHYKAAPTFLSFSTC